MRTDKRKICVVVTARPSYSRIRTALRAIQQRPDLELQLVVAGSALLDRYGKVTDCIEGDGFPISQRVHMTLEGATLSSMAKSTGFGTSQLATVFENLLPNIIVTVADRYETMSTAIAASYMNIPLVHIQGGEVTGSIDEKVRHAVSKLADLHLVASADARERLVRMGERPETVIITGCPSIDLAEEVRLNPALDFEPERRYGGVGVTLDRSNGYVVVMQHPVTTEHAEAGRQIAQTLRAVRELGLPAYWFWPNIDAGSDTISNVLRTYREEAPGEPIHFFKNFEGKDFLKLLVNSRCLIGNSSVGIRECAYLGVPVVNIGRRQNRRVRARNVVDVGYSASEILSAARAQVGNGRYQSDSLYGDGRAGERIANVLSSAELTFEKAICY